MKHCILALAILLQGCYLTAIPDSDEPVYKFNPMTQEYELTNPESKLRYNVYSREYEYVK